MIASTAPSATISRTAMTRSSSSLNSWPTSSSASSTFGETTFGARAHGVAQRVAVGVDDDDEAELAQLLDEVGVDVGVHAARQRAGEDHDRRAAREVQQLVVEELELAAR